jgi:hypothetical protein
MAGYAPLPSFAAGTVIGSCGWKAAAHPALSDWPVLSHNPYSGPDRGAGHEAPRFYNFTRRRNGWTAIRRACAEGDAVIGFLSSEAPGAFTSLVATFRQGLSETGYV